MADILDIQINIGASTEDLGAEIQKAENLLKKLQSALKKSTDVNEINQLNTKIGSVNNSLGVLGERMNSVGRPVNNATTALSNLSRVAQDAPYGFIGIANNLNPLLESFQSLSTKSNGATGALKQMAAGLMGPAGIGLALGVVSSLAVTYGKEIAEFFNGPTEKLKSFREELKKLNEEIYKIVGEAQSNRTVGLNLVNVISGGNPTQQQEALKRLKALYSDNAAIKEATIKTDKAYLIHLVNVASKQQEFAGKEKNTQDVLDAAYARRKKLEAQRDDALSKVKTDYGGSEGYNKKQADKERARVSRGFNKGFAEIDLDIANAKKKNQELINALTDIPTPDPKTGAKKSPSAIVNYAAIENKALNLELAKMKALREKFNKLDLSPILDVFNPKKDAAEEKRKSYFQNQAKDNLESSNKNGLGDFLEKDSKKRIATFKREDKELEDLQKSYEDFANSVANFGGNLIQTLFQPLQEGESVIDNVTKLFEQLAISIAAAAFQALIFEAIMSTLDIASGGGASAGKAGGSLIRKIFGFADGGIVTGPTLGMIGEGSESEAILPLSKLGNVMQSSFNAGSMSGYGGSQGGGVAVLRGQDLLVAINRTQRASALKGQNISLA